MVWCRSPAASGCLRYVAVRPGTLLSPAAFLSLAALTEWNGRLGGYAALVKMRPGQIVALGVLLLMAFFAVVAAATADWAVLPINVGVMLLCYWYLADSGEDADRQRGDY